jgi:hypothetical protein
MRRLNARIPLAAVYPRTGKNIVVRPVPMQKALWN